MLNFALPWSQYDFDFSFQYFTPRCTAQPIQKLFILPPGGTDTERPKSFCLSLSHLASIPRTKCEILTNIYLLAEDETLPNPEKNQTRSNKDQSESGEAPTFAIIEHLGKNADEEITENDKHEAMESENDITEIFKDNNSFFGTNQRRKRYGKSDTLKREYYSQFIEKDGACAFCGYTSYRNFQSDVFR